MKLIIGTPVHNNLKYTKMFFDSVKCSYPYELWAVNNGSKDGTLEWLIENDINVIDHKYNMGFAYAYNDMLDVVFGDGDNLLLFCGNDIIFNDNCIDQLVQALQETDYEMFCGHEIIDKTVVEDTNENAMKEFRYDFLFEEKKYDKLTYVDGGMNHTCLIRQKSVFDKVGYYDTNFYPAYFEDNDYSMRCRRADVKYGTVQSALFRHFWSRTIYEGGAMSLNQSRFEKNRAYYISKWGGVVNKEANELPFNYKPIKISERESEEDFLARLSRYMEV